MIYQLILLVHVFAAICIVGLVLVQQGKGASLGAAFGSGASQTVFGSRGSGSFLFRITASFVAVFFITSICLNYIASRAAKQEAVISLPTSTQTINEKPSTTTSAPTSNVTPGEIPARK